MSESASSLQQPIEACDEDARFEKSRQGGALAVKRLIDIVVSSVLFICVLPFFPIIALLIYLDSPGPIFFKPRVIGRGGRQFHAYKFRTMHQDAFQRLLKDPALLDQYKTNLKVQNDPRITRIGYVLRKTSIDELPQLMNVLWGEMSLVGPRILGKIELEKFGECGSKILRMKPGMAGLWVASGRHSLSFEERIRLELNYVENWSLWLDFKCFMKTVLVAFRAVGAQ